MQCIGGFLSAPLDSDNPWNHGAYEGMPYEEMVENAAGGLVAGLVQVRRGHYVFNGWDLKGRISVTAAKEFKAFVSDSLDDEAVVVVPEGSELVFYDDLNMAG